jgi:4-hydroxy-tetrahydrodipicolinate reductase
LSLLANENMSNESQITIAVNGALGRMGQTVMSAVNADDAMQLVAGIDAAASAAMVSAPGTDEVPLGADAASVIAATSPQVIVDFSNATGAMAVARAALPAGVRLVSGSTGLSADDLKEIEAMVDVAGTAAISAPNFAMGAVLLTHLARIASRYFDYADLIESHHEAKLDAPSGTALAIAEAMAQGRGGDFEQNIAEKETLPGTRGGSFNGINVHSARMVGRVARHEVVFGATGQTLTMIHDSINRDSFMPGVLMAVKQVMVQNGLVIGLDKVLGLDDGVKP